MDRATSTLPCSSRTPRTAVSSRSKATAVPAPWEEPGYTFSIGWPYGYVPTASQLPPMKRSTLEHAADSRRARAVSPEGAKGWGAGSIKRGVE
jgi:hypothetical protein